MKKAVLLLCSLVAALTILSAQTPKEYIPLRSYSPLPSTLFRELESQIASDLGDRYNKTSDEQKRKFDTVCNNDIFLRNLLLSGEVLYNDSLGIYVNKVADELFKENPVLRKQLHFYMLHSSAVNSYSLGRGYIFITTGLFAQLENEAQLAFILAREASHFFKHHRIAINTVIPFRLYNSDLTAYSKLLEENADEPGEREEQEADDEAMKLLQKSSYSLKGALDAFDLFRYKHLPFDDPEFDRSFFETEDFRIPDAVFLKDVTPVTDAYSSEYGLQHSPGIKNRKRRQELVVEEATQTGRKFINPKAEFIRLREMARFELCSDLFKDGDYKQAIYASYSLLKKNPDNHYLQKVISKSLYALTIAKSVSHRNAVPVYTGMPFEMLPEVEAVPAQMSWSSVEGNHQRLSYLFDHIEAKSLNIMSVSYAWRSYKISGDRSVRIILDSLLKELFTVNKMRSSDFSRLSMAEIKTQDSLKALEDQKAGETETSKYETIRKMQAKSEAASPDANNRYAFVSYFKDPEFTGIFEQNYKSSKDSKGTGNNNIDLSMGREKIPGVVMLRPTYASYLQKGTYMLNFDKLKGSMEQKMQRQLREQLSAQRVRCTHLYGDSLANGDAEKYNDLAALQGWITEREAAGRNPDIALFDQELSDAVMAKYGVSCVAVCNVRVLKEKDGYRSVHLFKVYDLVTGKLLQFNIQTLDYISSENEIAFFIANCAKELGQRIKR